MCKCRRGVSPVKVRVAWARWRAIALTRSAVSTERPTAASMPQSGYSPSRSRASCSAAGAGHLRRQNGWYLAEIRALLRLDTPQPESHERRRIVSTRADLREVMAWVDQLALLPDGAVSS